MCRLHRPGQQKKVTIDFWVYGTDPTLGEANNQLQALGMAVMSDKVRASAVVSGSVGAGLAALNQTGSDIMSTLRDLLLSENADTLPTLNATSQVTTSRRITDSGYAWIEAEIERYDDLRCRPIVLPSAPISVELRTEQRTFGTLAAEENLPLFGAVTDTLNPLDENAQEEAEVDALALLVKEVDQINVTSDPFAVKPVEVPNPSPTLRRRKPKLTDAPVMSICPLPPARPSLPMPQVPLVAAAFVPAGVQIALF